MDTGPRFGDIYLENDLPPGTSDWHWVEANNAKYKENQKYRSPDTPENRLFSRLCLEHRKCESLGTFLNKFLK